ERADALGPRLSKLTVKVAADVAGLEVRRNGSPVGHEIWGAPVPVDPGSYLVEATAPGKRSWSTRYEVPPQPGSFEVAVPALEDAPGAAATGATPAPPPPVVQTAPAAPIAGAETREAPPQSGDSQRLGGLGLGALGIVGLGIGVGFTISAVVKDGQAD